MLTSRAAIRRLAIAFVAATMVTACDEDSVTQVPSVAGTYRATTFQVTPQGQAPIDVLARGGTLELSIASDNSTSGTLTLPASVTGVAALTASMVGTAVQTGNTVRFQQSADTFVRDISWTVNSGSLVATDQTAGSARFTINL
ncbi:MAG: hypothetical protein MUE41_03305, partial [Gemmatimonadaceae bacterium]|nr:hypothetical protein [Gemmatimonadaceae bacterium]